MKIRLILLLLIFSFLPFSCKVQSDYHLPDNSKIKDTEDIISFSGRVVYKNFEGGFWGIVSDDGKHYDPLVLPKQFQTEGIRVEGKARQSNVAHFHMWGTIVDLIELKTIDEGDSDNQ